MYPLCILEANLITSMSRPLKEFYSSDFKSKQQSFFSSLPEKQARHFLAMEYLRLGRGSQRYLARVFGCGRQRIQQGVRELESCSYQPNYQRQRKEGGGRKKRELDS